VTQRSLTSSTRVGEVSSEHLNVLLSKVGGLNEEYCVGNALRIDPTNKLVEAHSLVALKHHKNQNIRMWKIVAQYDIIQTSKNLDNVDRDTLIPTDVNKTGGLPKELTIFVGAKVMLRYNVDTEKGLVMKL
jgi:hypothetical protein